VVQPPQLALSQRRGAGPDPYRPAAIALPLILWAFLSILAVHPRPLSPSHVPNGRNRHRYSHLPRLQACIPVHPVPRSLASPPAVVPPSPRSPALSRISVRPAHNSPFHYPCPVLTSPILPNRHPYSHPPASKASRLTTPPRRNKPRPRSFRGERCGVQPFAGLGVQGGGSPRGTPNRPTADLERSLPAGSCSRQMEAPAPAKRHGDCGCRRGCERRSAKNASRFNDRGRMISPPPGARVPGW
jgi:hypothetical protein